MYLFNMAIQMLQVHLLKENNKWNIKNYEQPDEYHFIS